MNQDHAGFLLVRSTQPPLHGRRSPVAPTITGWLLMQAHPPWRYTGPKDNVVASMTEPRDSVDSPTSGGVTQKATGLTWRQTLHSAPESGLGVQTAHNRQRDFAAGFPRRFVVTGVILTALFIGALVSVVRFIVA